MRSVILSSDSLGEVKKSSSVGANVLPKSKDE